MADAEEVQTQITQPLRRDDAIAIAAAKLKEARREITEALQMLELAALN